jgi:hypothetical protein
MAVQSTTQPQLMTAAEAYHEARARGMKLNLDTVRRIARQADLTLKLGRGVFIHRQGWLQLLDNGHPDPMTDREKSRTSAPNRV